MSVYDSYIPPAGGGGLFLKFEDDYRYQVHIISDDPVVFESTFTKPDGEENVSTKYAWLVYDKEGKTARVLQLPVTAYKQIASYAKNPEYGDPTSYDVYITRTGKPPKVEYSILPSRTNSDVTSEMKEAVKDLDLKAIISKGQGVQHVNYLSSVIGKDPDHSKDVDTLREIADNDDIDDKPIDISEIPF